MKKQFGYYLSFLKACPKSPLIIFGLFILVTLFSVNDGQTYEEENYLTPQEVNLNAFRLDGDEVFVKGFVVLGTNSRYLIQSEDRNNQYLKTLEADRSEEEMEEFFNDCLTLVDADFLFQHSALFNGKTITFKGVVLENYNDGVIVDLQACPTPAALKLDQEYLKTLLTLSH